jgi:ABC-type glutathione transport system ATPase component
MYAMLDERAQSTAGALPRPASQPSIHAAGLPPPQIRTVNLGKDFIGRNGLVSALSNVTLEVQKGQFCCIVGPSGCGKSTLLRIIAGLETNSSGELAMAHFDRSKPLHSMVFQEQSVFPWMTVECNVEYGLRMRGVPRAERRDVVSHYLDKVGLSIFREAYLLYGAALTRKNPEAGRRYMVAYLRALRAYREAFIDGSSGRQEILAILKKYNMEVTPETPMLDFPADATPSFVGLDELVAWHMRMSNIRTQPDLAALRDDSFRQYALSALAR